MTITIDVGTEFEHYIKCALWSTNADHLDPEGTGAAGSLEDHFSSSDIDPDALKDLRTEFEAFIDGCDPDALEYWTAELGAGRSATISGSRAMGTAPDSGIDSLAGVGHAFGEHLTAEAKPYGDRYIYAVGDELYAS